VVGGRAGALTEHINAVDSIKTNMLDVLLGINYTPTTDFKGKVVQGEIIQGKVETKKISHQP